MSLKDDLSSEVAAIFDDAWATRAGTVVPESSDVKLGKDAVKLTATVLYADLSGSTRLVDGHRDWFAAEVYKAYLRCAAKILVSDGGVITAYDGDRIMAVFIGETKSTAAVRSALKINWTRENIVNTKIVSKYPTLTYRVEHTVGVDTSPLFIARTGIRGSNDLVWVGRAANYAAKLSARPSVFPTRITKDVYDELDNSMKISDKKNIWTTTDGLNNVTTYGTTYWYPL
jgi:class 3 adenylate cyclase